MTALNASVLDDAVRRVGPRSPMIRWFLAGELERAIRHKKRLGDPARHYISKIKKAYRVLSA